MSLFAYKLEYNILILNHFTADQFLFREFPRLEQNILY